MFEVAVGHKPKKPTAPKRPAGDDSTLSGGDKVGDEPLSDRAAEAKAKELWGPNGAAWIHAYSKKTDWDRCRVGIGIGDVRDEWRALGKGPTWEKAFENARQMRYCL